MAMSAMRFCCAALCCPVLSGTSYEELVCFGQEDHTCARYSSPGHACGSMALWPCQKHDQTKKRASDFSSSFRSKKSDWGVRLGGVASRLGLSVRIGGLRLGGKCQDWGLVPGLGVADRGDCGRIGGILSGLVA